MKLLLTFFLLSLSLASKAELSLIELRKTYFTTLDFNNEKVLKLIPSYEKKLVDYSDPILQGCEKNNCKLNQEQALILVYVSMYIRNTSDAVAAGLLDPKLIPSLNSRLSFQNLDDLFGMRELYRLRLLDQAQKFLAGDKLVEGFKLGTEIWYEKFTQEKISENLIKAMMKLAKKEAIPNIFSALIIANEIKLSEADQQKINKLRKKALNKFRVGLLKRSPRPHDRTVLAFNSEQYAPYASQAARVILADATLKESMKLTGFARGYAANVALGTYQSLFKAKTIEQTNRWPNKNILVKRISMTEEFLATGSNPQMDNEENRNLYSCASCHSPE